MPSSSQQGALRAGAQATSSRFEKTRVCKFYTKNRCTRGAQCTYAHSDVELQQQPDYYKTQICYDFVRSGTCARGSNCTFAHGPTDLHGGTSQTHSGDLQNLLVQDLPRSFANRPVAQDSGDASRVATRQTQPASLQRGLSVAPQAGAFGGGAGTQTSNIQAQLDLARDLLNVEQEILLVNMKLAEMDVGNNSSRTAASREPPLLCALFQADAGISWTTVAKASRIPDAAALPASRWQFGAAQAASSSESEDEATESFLSEPEDEPGSQSGDELLAQCDGCPQSRPAPRLSDLWGMMPPRTQAMRASFISEELTSPGVPAHAGMYPSFGHGFAAPMVLKPPPGL